MYYRDTINYKTHRKVDDMIDDIIPIHLHGVLHVFTGHAWLDTVAIKLESREFN